LKRPSRWTRFFKRSPIISTLDGWMVRLLGPIGAERKLKELEVLSWLPMAVPPGPDAKYYGLPPSILVDHCVSREQFEGGKRWERTRYNLEAMHRLCAESGSRFVVVYAPTQAHVILPLVWDTLPAEDVRAFVELRAKVELPPANAFMKNLLEYLSVKEAVTREWCARNDVPFISLTGPLRDAVWQGRQAYFTYNDHWTPVGHDVAAGVVADFLRSQPAPMAERLDAAGQRD
jgi:hypothetical protein